jgi:hypothetical protein
VAPEAALEPGHRSNYIKLIKYAKLVEMRARLTPARPRTGEPVRSNSGGVMSAWDRKGSLVRGAGAALVAAAAIAAVPGSAAAAAGTQTLCGGSLSKAPTSLEPNLLNYQFNCDWGITAYTLIVNRQPSNFDTIDDFSPNALVFDASGNALSTVSFTCAGDIPGDGVSCNTGGGTTYSPAPDTIQGQLDPVDPYCAHVPPGSRKGAQPEPQAVVELVITDTNGAENGPFRLNLSPGCPPPPKPKAKAKAKAKAPKGKGKSVTNKSNKTVAEKKK